MLSCVLFAVCVFAACHVDGKSSNISTLTDVRSFYFPQLCVFTKNSPLNLLFYIVDLNQSVCWNIIV